MPPAARIARPGHLAPGRWVEDTCLRGAVRANDSRVFVMTAVRHDDALTAALREIGAKNTEIPEFDPLLTRSTQQTSPTP